MKSLLKCDAVSNAIMSFKHTAIYKSVRPSLSTEVLQDIKGSAKFFQSFSASGSKIAVPKEAIDENTTKGKAVQLAEGQTEQVNIKKQEAHFLEAVLLTEHRKHFFQYFWSHLVKKNNFIREVLKKRISCAAYRA